MIWILTCNLAIFLLIPSNSWILRLLLLLHAHFAKWPSLSPMSHFLQTCRGDHFFPLKSRPINKHSFHVGQQNCASYTAVHRGKSRAYSMVPINGNACAALPIPYNFTSTAVFGTASCRIRGGGWSVKAWLRLCMVPYFKVTQIHSQWAFVLFPFRVHKK